MATRGVMIGIRSARTKSNVKRKRVCYIIPDLIDTNLEIYSLTAGVLKQDAVTEALAKFLESKGMDPTRIPKLTFKY